ncbi:MAG: mycothiol system anti-sigma-R factor [Propionibacteriaceae bacterium]|jgi:anti-sigma factor (TIGR02949 family)|nr:mycothiol system anti-sigma-R factor [Propionibacteriaceae bacterium]
MAEAPRGIACEDVLRRVNLFLDHELDEAAADDIRRHIAACEHCSDEVDVWALVRHVVKRSYHPEHAPSGLLQRVTAQLHAAETRRAAQ